MQIVKIKKRNWCEVIWLAPSGATMGGWVQTRFCDGYNGNQEPPVMTTADLEKLVHNKFPLEWIEARDFERMSFERATWIPLLVGKKDVRLGRFGTSGFRDGYQDIDSIVVPLDLKADFQEIDWQSVSRHNSDGAWADDNDFYPPASHGESACITSSNSKKFCNWRPAGVEPTSRTGGRPQINATRRFVDSTGGR